jgi:uncharacterized membrane protein YhaH (DUF805 family)
MQSHRFAFSPNGRVAPRPFAIAILVFYLASFLAQVLLATSVTARLNVWPFLGVQAALLWVWFALHVRRLRDAGRPTGTAAGIATLYGLALVLLVLVVGAMGAPDSHPFVVVAMVGQILADPEPNGFGMVVLGLIALVVLPILIAIGFSVRTALGGRAP